MSIINYSHASELEQVHKEEIQSRLCNEEPSLKRPPGCSHHTHPFQESFYSSSSGLDAHSHTYTRMDTHTQHFHRCCVQVSQRPQELETIHQTFYYNTAFSVLIAARALTLCPHCPPAVEGMVLTIMSLNSDESLVLTLVHPLCGSQSALRLECKWPTGLHSCRGAPSLQDCSGQHSGLSCQVLDHPSSRPHFAPPYTHSSHCSHTLEERLGVLKTARVRAAYTWHYSPSDLHGLL